MITPLREQSGASAPKYARAERAIVEAIARGAYAPGARLPSEIELSRQMGVARMTARRALDHLVEQGVLERRAGVGTFVRAGRPAATNVGLVIFHTPGGISSRLGWNLIETIRRQAEARGFGLRVTVLVEPGPPPAQLAAELRTAGVAATGLGGFLDSDREYIRALADLIPCVLFHKQMAGLALPGAQPDLGEAARLMVDFFVRRERRRIGLVVPNVQHPLFHDAEVSIAAELHRRGLRVDKSLWFLGTDQQSEPAMRQWVEEMVASPRRPDGLIVLGDALSECLRQSLKGRGESLGREMDLLTCSNAFDRETAPAPWASLVWNLGDAARESARLLLDLAQRPEEAIGAPVYMAKPWIVEPALAETAAPASTAASQAVPVA